VSALDSFQQALDDLIRPARARDSDPVLLPMRLAEACVHALPIDGAGISAIHGTNGLRVPLGASDPASAAVEALQTTIGDGPCLAAAQSREPVTASLADIERRWPVFFEAMMRESPFRSVASVALSRRDEPWGALDFYSTQPDGTVDLPISAFAQIGPHVSDALLGVTPTYQDFDELSFPWLETEPAQSRFRVWQAVGMLMSARGMTNPDALAILSGWAYGQGLSLDQVAADLIQGRLNVDALSD
jgi:GAF domain-containing protein